MKKCKFDIEAFFGRPFDYENWYESMIVELTDEQFDRYCEALRRWQATDEWKNWNDENGHDYLLRWAEAGAACGARSCSAARASLMPSSWTSISSSSPT